MNREEKSAAARPRRLRALPGVRGMVRETSLSPGNLVYPLFAVHGRGVRNPIKSMPGIFQFSVENLAEEAREAAALGVPAVLLFGIPETKDPAGSESHAKDGIIPRAIAAVRDRCPDLVIITDVCMCEYTDHGHCGILNTGAPRPVPALPEGYLLNDRTLDVLRMIALAHAEAGADIVAPSGMIDGMVGAIRGALDTGGFSHLPIMSYAVKYASSFYGPFREAAQGAPKFGDRRSHQMDPANAREALHEAALDVQEGADFLMVKPALPYLDVIRLLRDRFPEHPLVAYNVSGEYAMLKAAAAQGWLDGKAAALEALTGIRRAGADIIITYHAKEAARWLTGAG
jgi:porphobilinogen synthase